MKKQDEKDFVYFVDHNILLLFRSIDCRGAILWILKGKRYEFSSCFFSWILERHFFHDLNKNNMGVNMLVIKWLIVYICGVACGLRIATILSRK